MTCANLLFSSKFFSLHFLMYNPRRMKRRMKRVACVIFFVLCVVCSLQLVHTKVITKVDAPGLGISPGAQVIERTEDKSPSFLITEPSSLGGFPPSSASLSIGCLSSPPLAQGCTTRCQSTWISDNLQYKNVLHGTGGSKATFAVSTLPPSSLVLFLFLCFSSG